VAETPEKETQGDKQPEAAQQGASSRVPAIVVSLSALAVISAATAYSLPNFNRFAAQSPHETASVPIPDPVVSATLKDIQLSQQQNAAVLVSLAQSSATQQADLKRITRQLSLLTAQVNSLQNPVTPSLTTSSIPPSTTSSIPPSTTSSIPRPNPRARIVQASRKVLPPVLPPTLPPLPKPAGPVSVRGAPLSPAPAPGSGAS
jgi:hypothetical protein